MAGVEVRVERSDDGSVVLVAPYHPDLPSRAKALGGRWTGSAWRFDGRDEGRVRELARSVYGTDGTDSPELVTLRVTLTEREAVLQELWLAGRLVARRPGRDVPVRLGDGVIIVSGEFPRRAGSARYPELGGVGVVLEVRDVPRPAVPDRPNVQIVAVEAQAATATDPDPLAAFTDEQLITALERRGYVVIRTTASQPAR